MHIQAYLEKHRLSQAQFAEKIGVTQGAVWQWIQWLDNPNKGTRMSAEKAKEIEDRTEGEITRHDLRPDIYQEPV